MGSGLLSELQTDQVKQLIDEFNKAIRSLTLTLNSELRNHRILGLDIQGEQELPIEQNLMLGYFENARELIKKTRALSVVYRSENLLGRFGPSSALLEEKPALIDLTPFDFTDGFAKMCRSEWKSGLVVHRNPVSGEIEWLSSWKSGLAIVGINLDGTARTTSNWRTGSSSAYNPITNSYEYFEGDWKTPSAAVYNPNKGIVEFQQGNWKSGVSGVYTPLTQEIEWSRPEWKSGIAGYFDPAKNQVIWVKEWKSGVACIWRIDGNYYTSVGFYGGSF